MKDSFTLDAARQILRACFRYEDFRPGQTEIVQSVLEGKDTVAIMPTGGGKSICYQVPALLFPGLTIVVSPLISLMKDQVDALARTSVMATFVNSMLEFREMADRIDKARHGWFKLMYVAPERFESRAFLDRMRNIPISLFAVDEAHCISEWGSDFRPSYLKLKEAIANLGAPKVLALTATATPDVRLDIIHQLGLQNPNLIVRGFNRENLAFRVVQGGNKLDYIFNACISGDSGIIYAGTRNTVEEIAERLKRHSIRAEAYHAGLSDDQRKTVQERFMSGDIRVIVATTAFGMGIDKADVRFVIHHDMPGSIEQYYQEAGRAGRDGKESVCTILYHPSDRNLPEFFIRQSGADKTNARAVYSFLHNIAGTQVGQSYREPLSCRNQTIAGELSGSLSETDVRRALDLLESSGHIRRISPRPERSTVQYLYSPERLRYWLTESADPAVGAAAMALLRTVDRGAFYDAVEIEIERIAEKCFISVEALVFGLRELHTQGIIEYREGKKSGGILLLGERVSLRDLPINDSELKKREKHKRKKLQAMEQYILGKACRRNLILEYFEETDINGICGKCDTCASTVVVFPARTDDDIAKEYFTMILHCAAETGGKFGRTTIADVLRGAKTQRIAQYKLYDAMTYGKAPRVDKRILLEAINSLINLGWLDTTDNQHPAVHITPVGQEKLGIKVHPLSLPRPVAAGEEEVRDRILYEALRSERRRIAAERNTPSHTLIADAVLRRIANAMPHSEEAMVGIEGMGPATFRKCGKQLLRIIAGHKNQNELADAITRSKDAIPLLSPALKATFELCVQGLGIPEIAERRGLTDGTISQHISELLSNGVQLNIDQFVPSEHQRQIRKAMSIVKKPDFKRIKAMIDEEITYAEIRVMLAFVSKKK